MSWSRTISLLATWAPVCAVTYPPSSCSASVISMLRSLAGDRACSADLLLQLQNAVHQRLCRRRAARDIDVHGHDAVASADHGVGVVVVAAAIGAGAHGDHPAGLGHLVVDLAQRRRHLVAERAGNDHDVGLARAAARDHAEAVE